MDIEDNDKYSEYFSFRNVAPDFYDQFVFPAYLKEVLPMDKNAAILDIGCGFGQMLKALQEEGYKDLSGIDISEEATKYCNANGIKVTRIDCIENYCRNSNKRFDFIIMSHVVEHLAKSEVIETLRSIRVNLLKKEGSLMVMVPNAQSNTGAYWAYEDFTHTNIFTSGSLYYVLKSAGFESVEFIDPDSLSGSRPGIKQLRKFLLFIYKKNKRFWNIVTNSSFHKPSPQIFSYELKALAKQFKG